MSTPRETAIETGASQGIGAGNVPPADNRLTAGDEIPAGAGVIEVHVRELSQLFNSMDPSPFLDKDLDVDAEEYTALAAARAERVRQGVGGQRAQGRSRRLTSRPTDRQRIGEVAQP